MNLKALGRPTLNPSVVARLLFIFSECLMLTTVEGASIGVAKNLTLEADPWWQEIRSPYQNTHELVGGRRPDGTMQARASIMVFRHSSSEKALARLEQEAKLGDDAKSVRVGGRPGLRVKAKIETERRLDDESAPIRNNTPRVTTFVAIDRLVVVIAATVAQGAGADALKQVDQLALRLQAPKSLPGKELDAAISRLDRAISKKPEAMATIAPRNLAQPKLALAANTRRTELTTNAVLAGRSGELEVAASPDATDVVIATNNAIFFSNNSGSSWSGGQAYPLTGFMTRRGDPSVARAPSGRFYFSYLCREVRGAGDCAAAGADCRETVSLALSEPAERGADFDFTSHVAVCDPNEDPFGTDQPHMVVAARPAALDQEALYVVWRRSVPDDASAPATCANRGAAHFTTELTCSGDGGRTWTHSLKIDDNGRHPRVGVGADGKAYVIAVRRSSGGAIDLTRVSSCADGLEIDDDFPIVVESIQGVECPIPGLDRCNTGNTLSSPTVSPDPSRALTVFTAFAVRTAEGNEDIIVRASEDGGVTFPARTTVNDSGIVARRFMPWSSAVPGGVYVGWYDRELATAAANDLTCYHAAFLGFESDNVVTTTESIRRFAPVDISVGVADPQCSLWPTGPRDIGDSENCSVQPQCAGLAPAADAACADPTRCDFSDSVSTANCNIGGGQPKYGDYNGITSAGQRALVAWASGTAPAGAAAPPLNRIGAYFAVVGHAEPESPVDVERGRIDFTCPDELCRIRVPVAKLCQLAIDCPGCGNNQHCLGDAMVIDGLPPEATIRLVDELGHTVAEAKRKADHHWLATGSRKFDPITDIKGLSLAIDLGKTLPQGSKHSLTIKLEGK